MIYDQCTPLEATEDFMTFEGRSMRRFTKGQQVWVVSTREEQQRLGTIRIARKGKNGATAQYFNLSDVEGRFRVVPKP